MKVYQAHGWNKRRIQGLEWAQLRLFLSKGIFRCMQPCKERKEWNSKRHTERQRKGWGRPTSLGSHLGMKIGRRVMILSLHHRWQCGVNWWERNLRKTTHNRFHINLCLDLMVQIECNRMNIKEMCLAATEPPQVYPAYTRIITVVYAF